MTVARKSSLRCDMEHLGVPWVPVHGEASVSHLETFQCILPLYHMAFAILFSRSILFSFSFFYFYLVLLPQ